MAADPAAEWGFVPFAAATDYPELPPEAAQRESGGKRSQKTNIRRRQQLEKLVAGVIQLPATAAKAASTAAAKLQTANGGATAAGPQSNGSKSSGTKATGSTRETPHFLSAATKQLPLSADVTKRDLRQPDCDLADAAHAQDAGVQASSKKARKRKADAMHPSCKAETESLSQTDGDRPLSRKQQKQKLRRQKHEARKRGQILESAAQSVQSGGIPVAMPELAAMIENSNAAAVSAPQASGGSAELSATKQPEAHPVATPGSNLSRKQQKRLERQQRYTAQKLEQPHPTQAATDRSATASGTVADLVPKPKSSGHETPQTNGPKAPPGSMQLKKLPLQSSMKQLGPSDHTDPTVSHRSPAILRQQLDRLKSAKAAGASAPSTADVNGASRLPPNRQSQALGGGSGGSSGLLDKMRAKLQGGRFRWLNEQLYSSTGNNAFDLMQGEPDLYEQYHEGFRHQAADWPQQPVELAIAWLKAKPADLVVADFGCGDAQIAAEVKQKVNSFDLVATVPGVTACNMANTPLEDASIDAAVFCLALMGTDYGDFLQEAHRVLRSKGWLWICEVRSRFAGQSNPAASAEERDAQSPASSWVMVNFTKALQRLGFRLVQRKVMNKMFVIFELRKDIPKGKGSIEWPELKGCVYRKR